MLTADTTPVNAGTRSRSRFDALAVAAAFVSMVVVLLLLRPETLSAEAHRMAALSIAILILWATEALPIAVTAILAVILQPVLGLSPPGVAFRNFMSPVFFFVIAMFIIAYAWMKSGLARRFALWMISRAGTDARRVVYVFVLGTGLVSTVISDVPVAAIFMTIALGIFRRLKLAPGESNFGKAIMIGIPVAALVGGVGTPAGASTNVLGLFMIEQNGGPRISFLAWTAIGLPVVVVLLPIAAWVITKFYPPEVSTIGELTDIEQERRAQGRLRSNEWKVIAIMGTMITLWIASSWVPALDTVLVATAGACAMFLPGVKLFGWKEVQDMTGWDAVIMIGGVTSLGAAATETGLARSVVESSLGGLQTWNPVWIIALISLFTVFIHFLLPVNPVINAVLIPPIMVLATASGQNPALYALPVAFMASCAFLLPLDAVPLVTYTQGYYKMFDMLRPGIVISLIWTVLMTASLLLIGPLLGLV
jgi:sodium-dependent dicarboxylate transporter 2/3/5